VTRTLPAGFVVIWLVAPAAGQTATFTPDPVDLPAAKREAAVTWYTDYEQIEKEAKSLKTRFNEIYQ